MTNTVLVKIRFQPFLPLVLLMLCPTINYASAHNNLNSDDQTIGNYEVQVATNPEIPEANHPFELKFPSTKPSISIKHLEFT